MHNKEIFFVDEKVTGVGWGVGQNFMAFGFGFESLFASSHLVLGSQGPYLCKFLIRG
jgi:hypothetical protein